MSQLQEITQSYLIQQAKAIPFEVRKNVLMSFKETDIHQHLKIMFEKMEPNYVIEITHGVDELGKDLVIVRKDRISVDVIGVIVKCGSIRAKTAGDIDDLKSRIDKIIKTGNIKEIESQIEQAFSHPAEMKSFFCKLPVNRLFVVLVGEIGSHVRKRMMEEIEQKANISILDANWLIDNLTKFYPQVFFEGLALDFFQRKIEQLEVKYCMSKSGKNLSEYFVDPIVAMADIPIKFDDENLPLIVNQRKLSFSRLKTIIELPRHIAIVGDPGVGKSGALAKLAIDLFREAYQQAIKGEKNKKIEIPIVISARELARLNREDDLLNFYLEDCPKIDRLVIKVLMVDGLDEIASNERASVIERANLFARKYSSSLIITGRKVDIFNNLPTGFEKYELLPFKFGQAIKLFEKMVKNQKQLVILKQGLEKVKNQIPMVPLSLMLLIELVEKEKEIPASVTELYDRFLDVVLGRWDKEKGIEILFEYILKKKFLASLAYKEFLEKRRLEIPLEDFQRFSNDYAALYGWDIDAFIKEIERAGIISINDTVIYCHRSFLDYFTAFYIHDRRAEIQNLNDYIVRLYFDDLFGEVAFYYIGLMREISEDILNKIFAYEGDGLISNIDKFLSGTLLQAGWHTPTKLKYEGIEKAIALSPEIRQKLVELSDKKGHKMPTILGDFFLLTLSDFSFASGFLLKEVRSLFDSLSNETSSDSLYKMIILLWSSQHFLETVEMKKAVGTILESMGRISTKLSLEDQAKMFIFLRILDAEDKETIKMIDKKLGKMSKRFPYIFKKLLPDKRESLIK